MNDLRERIARAIYYAGQNPICFHENRKWENLAAGLQDSYRDTAEAVVDELGLTSVSWCSRLGTASVPRGGFTTTRTYLAETGPDPRHLKASPLKWFTKGDALDYHL